MAVFFRYMPESRLKHPIGMTGLPGARIHEESWKSDYDEACERGGLDPAESYIKFCRRLGVDISYDSFCSAMAYAFEPDAAVLALLHRVATKNIVGTAANGMHTHHFTGRERLVRELQSQGLI